MMVDTMVDADGGNMKTPTTEQVRVARWGNNRCGSLLRGEKDANPNT